MKINKNGYIFSIIFTFVTTFLLVFPLAMANTFTKPIADNYWRVQRYVKTLKTLGYQVDSSHPDEVKEGYSALEKFTRNSEGTFVKVSDHDIDKNEVAGTPISPLYYLTQVDGAKRFAGSFTGPGLWGNVTLSLGVDQNVEKIVGVQVLYQVETPGLGGRITETAFTDQFREVDLSKNVEFNSSGSKKAHGFDAIAGATITSMAVRDIINKAVPELKELATKMGGQ